MSVVTISPKFQVVIPQQIREAMGLAPVRKYRRSSTRTGLNLFRCGPSSRCVDLCAASIPVSHVTGIVCERR